METYHGFVRTPADAIKLFEACRLGLLPRVQRRLSEKERQSIRSGSVFVWDEREAGMRRWTDGKSWSASRVSGSFLTYREMEGKRGGGFGSARRGNNKTPDSGRGSDEDHEDGEPDGYRYKADGLMKQSFSITTSTGQHLHLISYYSRPQPGQADLPQPTNDPTLRHIVPVKGMYPESSMGETNQTPALTRAPMQQPPYMVPQHAAQQQYSHSYGQQGYGWPPSPAATPPYTHYTTAPYPHQLPHPSAIPPPSQHQYAPPHYEPSHYEPPRASLPPPHSQKPVYHQPYQSQHRVPSPRLHDGPRDHDLQIAAQAAMVDPRLSTGRNPPGLLPGLNSVTSSGQSVSILAADVPPPRLHSVSPPRSSHSDMSGMNGQARGSLSALLHHNGESHASGSTGSATDSPRSSGVPAPEKGNGSEDARALRMLDRTAFRAPPKQAVA